MSDNRNTTGAKSHSLSGSGHSIEVKQKAMSMFREGAAVSVISRTLEIPRTTVSGWIQRGKKAIELPGTPGRPSSLPPFNEQEVLKKVTSKLTWMEVREIIRAQSGETLSRRSVFRYMSRWRSEGKLSS